MYHRSVGEGFGPSSPTRTIVCVRKGREHHGAICRAELCPPISSLSLGTMTPACRLHSTSVEMFYVTSGNVLLPARVPKGKVGCRVLAAAT